MNDCKHLMSNNTTDGTIYWCSIWDQLPGQIKREISQNGGTFPLCIRNMGKNCQCYRPQRRL